MSRSKWVIKSVFNNEAKVEDAYSAATRKIEEFLKQYKDSEYLNVVSVHQEFKGYRVSGEIRLDFKPGVYASTRIKVARQIDAGVRLILKDNAAIADLVEYFVIVSNLHEDFFRRYKYVAIKDGKFYLVSLTTEAKVLPMDGDAAEELILADSERREML